MQGKTTFSSGSRVLYLCGDRAEESKIRDLTESVCIGREESVQGILFLNEEVQYPMYTPGRKEEFLRMLPVAVRKESREGPDADGTRTGMEEETKEWEHAMYFYSEKEEVRRMVSEFEAEADLLIGGSRDQVRKMTEEQIRIRMLEGILAATERRLFEYIESEKELRRELETLKAQGREGGS